MRIWILMRARNETIMVRMSVCYEVRGEWIRCQEVLEDLGQVIRIRTTIEFWLNPPGSAREEEREAGGRGASYGIHTQARGHGAIGDGPPTGITCSPRHYGSSRGASPSSRVLLLVSQKRNF